ncbi:MAG: asparagine synthase (glutamine-hydrolyzing) [Candidatus Magasanikbacteria bacterium RIFCSPHIGHO2_01_FULL_47_8]|uniref:asparagine synthase (glutamine-hydrolyzing) n=1 Tax=Candidatus Magasanikbacteria bacterium RIFCSPHIGHO2_01_FULL_47_8 TaxID=1798673 RepID=A0A1F6MF32_9BACT|nr:MAG: asparagine synthase (glutamine-hydrolyzing) [Candidatus Magasanikbacteria bacterium RIFCSPHIGHO2_01_FULL_47_8]
MCGINGFNFKNEDLILKMNQATSHRGPDETAVWCADEISFGHNRLAIIDLSPRGAQPMWDAARELVIIFNGEIYNFQELRDELKNKYTFSSASDTEVMLYAYREWGKDCVKKFNGIFAFAIWDTRAKKLFIARDPLGIKPLYYFYDGKQFIFSSEIKAILEHCIPREVNREAFNLYFQLLYIPEPHTMFQGIKKLPPASYLELNHDGKIQIEKYWQVNDFSDVSSYHDTKNEIKKLFKDSVRRQLISDRPVGVFLSGGIDSTAMLGAVSEFHSGKVKTFSVGFKDSQNPKKFNADFFLAQKTARHYDTDHHELLIGPEDIKNNLEKIARHLDEPNFNPTAGAIFLLSKMAKEKVAVVLGGDGGDELFGGYPRYYYSRLLSYYQVLPQLMRSGVDSLVRLLNHSNLADRLNLTGANRVLAFLAQKEGLLKRAISPDIYQAELAGNFLTNKYFGNKLPTHDFEKYFMDIDREGWLVDESLMRTDKMTMAAGLEERVPILDYRLVALSAKIPTSWKFSVWNQTPSTFQGKQIWRDAIRDYLPTHIINEQKRGWFTPMAKWLRGEFKDTVSEILSPQNLNSEFFNADEVQKIWQDHLSGKQYNLNIIWAIVMWQLWYNQFIKK